MLHSLATVTLPYRASSLPDGTDFGPSLPHSYTSSDGLYEPHHHHRVQLKPEESPVTQMTLQLSQV